MGRQNKLFIFYRAENNIFSISKQIYDIIYNTGKHKILLYSLD